MFSPVYTIRTVLPPSTLYARKMATTSRAVGRSAILAKRPNDVVITFAKRTAMGRARKGQLKDVPVDELLHALFKVAYTRTNADGLDANVASVLGNT